MNVSLLQKCLYLVLSGLLLLTVACSTGTYAKSTPSSTPSLQEQDPEFWRMWQSRQGVSG